MVCTRVGVREEVVEAALCAPDPPPVTSQFRRCVAEEVCLTHHAEAVSSAIGQWLVGLLRDVSISQV